MILAFRLSIDKQMFVLTKIYRKPIEEKYNFLLGVLKNKYTKVIYIYMNVVFDSCFDE
jgi:hypothetical protein